MYLTLCLDKKSVKTKDMACVMSGDTVPVSPSDLQLYISSGSTAGVAAHRLIRRPGELQRHVHPLASVGHAAIRLQADSRGGGIADDGHQLLPLLERRLLLDVHLARTSAIVEWVIGYRGGCGVQVIGLV